MPGAGHALVAPALRIYPGANAEHGFGENAVDVEVRPGGVDGLSRKLWGSGAWSVN